MTALTLFVSICLLSYLVGSLPFGLWIGLLWKGLDIRTLGSKNIGATNVLRVLGPGPGVSVFVLDTLKGGFGVMLAYVAWPLLPAWHLQMHEKELALPYLVVIGLCAILGHTFSLFLGFKGGKGVATSLGALLALNPPMAVIALLSWVAVLAVTRYVSAASLVAAYTLPFSAYLALRDTDRFYMLALGTALALLVTVKHRTNIKRLLTGTEAKIGERVEVPAETTGVN
ncbi:MAG: glycerol-3-phosphate 1-O-acyltransferase PlsY [Armatimonadota bacterium]